MNSKAEWFKSLAYIEYNRCKKYYQFRIVLMTLSFIAIIISVVSHGALLYVLSIVVLTTTLCSWLLNQRILSVRDTADILSRQAMLLLAYNCSSSFKLSHLVARVRGDQTGSEFGIPKPIKNVLFEHNGNGRVMLTREIHENSYWNHHQYRELSVLYGLLSTLFLVSALGPLFLIPFLYIDPDYIVPRIAVSALSFTIVYEFMDNAIVLRKSSRKMLEIDNELQNNYEVSEDRLLDIYVSFIIAKESAIDIPYFLYAKNRVKLNEGWAIRNAD